MRVFLVALLFVFAGWLCAQSTFRVGPGVVVGDTTQTHELILVNYSKILGLCLKISSEQVFFQLRNAEEPTVFPKSDVRFLGLFYEGEVTTESGAELTNKRRSRSSSIAFTDPTYHRTALPTRGKGQIRFINILYGIAEFNINENIQVGVGLFTPFGPMMTQRVRFQVAEEVHFGVSNQALYPLVVGTIGTPLIGDLQMHLTLGNENRFFNIGTGIFYNTEDDLVPVHLNMAMGARVSERWHLYGEMSIVDDSFDVLVFPSFSAAHTVRRHRWRYGFFSLVTPWDSPLIPIPVIGYEYHW